MLFEKPDIYLGVNRPHYGHFLLTTLPSLSYALNNKKLGFFTLYTKPKKRLIEKDLRFIEKNYYKKNIALNQFVEILNLENRIFTINQWNDNHFKKNFETAPTSFEIGRKLILKANFVKVVNSLKKGIDTKKENQKKYFLSRKKLKNGQRVSEEHTQEIESLFSKYDFEIIYPETLSIKNQLEIYTQAKILCGFNGSQLHNSIFCKNGTKIISIMDAKNKQFGTSKNFQESMKINNCILKEIKYHDNPKVMIENIKKMKL